MTTGKNYEWKNIIVPKEIYLAEPQCHKMYDVHEFYSNYLIKTCVLLVYLPVFMRICNVLVANVLQSSPKRVAKRPVLACEMGRFATRNGPFRKCLWPALFHSTCGKPTNFAYEPLWTWRL